MANAPYSAGRGRSADDEVGSRGAKRAVQPRGSGGARRANNLRYLICVAVFGAAAALAPQAGTRSVAHITAGRLSEAEAAEARAVGTEDLARAHAIDGTYTLVADTAQILDWKMMAGLDYDTGEMTPILRELDGEDVRIPGFIVPLEDFAADASEFLIVPYVGACVHVPPPPPNQLVYVQMEEGEKVKVDLWDPVWIHGRLKIASMKSVYGEVGFQLEGVRSEPFEY